MPRAGVLAGWVAMLAATASGCASAQSWGGHLSADPALDVNRANWVRESIAHDMALGALTEQSLVRIVSDNGGGYVMRITFAGQRGTFVSQRITMDTVLGTSPVRNPPPTRTVDGPDGVDSPDGQNPIECFAFTIGQADTMAHPPAREACPETALGSPSGLADREAGQVNSAGNLAAVLTISATPVPATRRDALARLARARAHALQVLSPSLGQGNASREWDYAMGHLSFSAGKALAAAAMPVPGGGCVYVTFGPGGNPGENVIAWPAPLAAACTGPSAVEASGPITASLKDARDVRAADEVSAVGCACLPEHLGYVLGHGVLAYMQAGSDLHVRAAFGYEPENSKIGRGEPRESRRCGIACRRANLDFRDVGPPSCAPVFAGECPANTGKVAGAGN